MGEDRQRPDAVDDSAQGRGPGRLIGSLRDALTAAGRDETGAKAQAAIALPAPAAPADVRTAKASPPAPKPETPGPSAAEAARDARGGGRPAARGEDHAGDRHVEIGAPTTRVIRGAHRASAGAATPQDSSRTQLIRGKTAVKRTEFFQDPVVGWLVIVGGPGLGAFRPIFEGNNTLGRAQSQRIPVDFGDDTISSEEQAYIRYDSADRTFLLVPNLAKTNVVAVNDRKPTGAVELSAMDLITMGRTQLVFVPFCGADFDWAELSELK